MVRPLHRFWRMWSTVQASSRSRGVDEAGFTLVETLVATLVLAGGVMAVAYLALASARVQATARQNSVVAMLAREKLEQLRAMAWTSDAALVPISDWSSDITTQPEMATGGPGLGLSPAGSLVSNVSGFCDFADGNGRWVGGGTAPPPGATWVRRWSVRAMAELVDTLALEVVIVPAQERDASAGASLMRPIAGARLLAVRTRRAR